MEREQDMNLPAETREVRVLPSQRSLPGRIPSVPLSIWVPAPRPDPLRVAVLVDLERTRSSGGHVKSWERFARAAARRLEGEIDLSVHFLGREAATEEISPGVRFVTHRPLIGTYLFDRLEKAPGH